jgi:hypothetical protein
MKSRFQKKILRKSRKQSIRRKIQKGGMSVEEATRLLHEYGCSFMETVAIASAMTQKGKVNDSLFHATIFLRNHHKKSWTDAVKIALLSKGDMNQVKMLLELEKPKKEQPKKEQPKKEEPKKKETKKEAPPPPPFYLARP